MGQAEHDRVVRGLAVAAAVPPAIVLLAAILGWVYTAFDPHSRSSIETLVGLVFLYVIPSAVVSFFCAFTLGALSYAVLGRLGLVKWYVAVAAGAIAGLIFGGAVPAIINTMFGGVILDYSPRISLITAPLGAAAGLGFWLYYRRPPKAPKP